MSRDGDPPSFALLLRHRVRLGLRAQRGSGRFRRRFAAVLSAAAGCVLFGASWQIFATLRREESEILAQLLMQTGVHTLFLFVLLRDAVAVPGHLFRASDRVLLGTAPVPAGRLLAYRVAEALFDSADAVLLFGAPFLLGFAAAAPHPIVAVPAALGGLAGLLVLSVLSLAIASLIWPETLGRGGQRRRGLLRVAALVFLLGLFGLLARGGSDAPGGPLLAVATIAAALEAFTPSGWAGRWMAAAAEGGAVPAWTLLSFGLAALALGFALSRMTGRWAEASQRAAEGGGGGPGTRTARGFLRRGAPGRRPGTRLAALLWRRDWLLLVREPGMLLDLATMAALLGILPILWRLNAEDATSSSWSYLLAAVVGAELAYEVASRSLPLERRATQWIRAAPVSVGAECRARPVLGLAVGWGAGLLVLVSTTVLLRSPPPALWQSLAVLSLTPPAALLGWAASLPFGEPAWRHPRQMLRLPGRLLLLVVAGLAGLAAAAADAGAPAAAGGPPMYTGVLALGSALAAGAAYLLGTHWRSSLE